MGKAYSLDLRARVVSALEEGLSTRQGGGEVFGRSSDSRDWGGAEALARRRSASQAGQTGSVL